MVVTVAMAGTVALARVNETEKSVHSSTWITAALFVSFSIGRWACGLVACSLESGALKQNVFLAVLGSR